jgi:hypothetical protein
MGLMMGRGEFDLFIIPNKNISFADFVEKYVF